MAPGTCIICGALGTTRWTLTSGEVASVADLCGEHSSPLQAVVDAAGTKPPGGSEEKKWGPAQIPQRQPRKSSFEPLKWTPPKE